MMKEKNMTLQNSDITARQTVVRPRASVVPAASVWNGRCRPLGPGGGVGVRKVGSAYRTPGPIAEGVGDVHPAAGEWDDGTGSGWGAALRTYVAGALIGCALFAGFLVATPSGDTTAEDAAHFSTNTVAAVR